MGGTELVFRPPGSSVSPADASRPSPRSPSRSAPVARAGCRPAHPLEPKSTSASRLEQAATQGMRAAARAVVSRPMSKPSMLSSRFDEVNPF